MKNRCLASCWLLCGALMAAVPCLGEGGTGWRFSFERASDTPLSNPHDVKLSADGRHLYVADVGSGNVVVLDAMTLARVDAFGGEQLRGTHDIDVAPDGRLYVADTHNGRIAIYRMQGTRGELVGQLAERLSGPEGVLVHPNGLVYAAGAWSNNVVAYRNGAVVHELRDGLSAPHDLELAPDGRIWLADAGNDRLLLLSEDLAIVEEIQGMPYDFDGVRYLDVLPDGTLFAADKNNHAIKVIDPSPALLAVLGSGRRGKGAGVFTTPEGVDSAGDLLWLADSGNDRIVKYRFERPPMPNQ
ncbi:MAG: NHL repeat-containing protein [Sedimenticolaceae bacterium]